MRIIISMEVDDDAVYLDPEVGDFVSVLDPDHEMGVTEEFYDWLSRILPGDDIDVKRG